MTVQELKAFLERLPDIMEVRLAIQDDSETAEVRIAYVHPKTRTLVAETTDAEPVVLVY